ncbi:MAG: glycosyltransferase [Butyrivibrio sp.]|nr:glycosyltransferase [Butyrivibrio sp.]
MSQKFGMIYFHNFSNEDIVWGLLLLGKDVEIISTDLERSSTSEEDAFFLSNELKEKEIDIAISYDFCPALSDACMKNGIKYVSWIFDSPLQMLFEKQVSNNCNYIFSFDKRQIEQTKSLFNCNIYYMPLGTNLTRNTAIEMNDADKHKFACDVSFIGNLYSEKEYKAALLTVSDKTKTELEYIWKNVYGKWDGTDRLYGQLTKNALEELKEKLGNSTAMDDDTLFVTALIVKAMAHKERKEMLERLSGYELYFYTNDKNVALSGVSTKGGLDYIEELPKAYRFSKINLNITMRGITSGIPLRVFDIMGMGGFTLTNYQPEVYELFSPGKDIEVYHDFSEMEEKVSYYLKNGNIREKIANAGAQTVKEKYSVENQVQKILEVVLR